MGCKITNKSFFTGLARGLTVTLRKARVAVFHSAAVGTLSPDLDLRGCFCETISRRYSSM